MNYKGRASPLISLHKEGNTKVIYSVYHPQFSQLVWAPGIYVLLGGPGMRFMPWNQAKTSVVGTPLPSRPL